MQKAFTEKLLHCIMVSVYAKFPKGNLGELEGQTVYTVLYDRAEGEARKPKVSAESETKFSFRWALRIRSFILPY